MQLKNPLPGPEAVITQDERIAVVQKALLSLLDASRAGWIRHTHRGHGRLIEG